MRPLLVIAISLAVLPIGVLPIAAHAHGCAKGAVVGGVVGHVAGHHAVAGAVVGCAIGHHQAKMKERAAAQAPQPQKDPPKASGSAPAGG